MSEDPGEIEGKTEYQKERVAGVPFPLSSVHNIEFVF